MHPHQHLLSFVFLMMSFGLAWDGSLKGFKHYLNDGHNAEWFSFLTILFFYRIFYLVL